MMDDTPALRCSYFSVPDALPSLSGLLTALQVPEFACGLCESVLEPEGEGDLPLAIGADGHLVSPDTCTSVRFEQSCKPTFPNEDLLDWQARRLAQKRQALWETVAASHERTRLFRQDASRLREQSAAQRQQAEALRERCLLLRIRAAVRRSSVAVR